MSRITLLFLMLLSFIVIAQTRVDTFPSSSLTVDEVILTPLSDGGCVARWCGSAVSDDGGVQLAACTDAVELKATVNQNRCAGLAAAGVNRVGRQLRFDLDAGAQ